MNQTESVAFWIGVIASIVGIVLSIVAIVFSILVDRRSSTISDKTIQSLQKIESAVERSSSDTRDLIKAAWDKLLGQVDNEMKSASTDSSAKQIAAGIAAELRSELSTLATQKGDLENKTEKADHLEKYLKELEASLSAQFRAATASSEIGSRFEAVLGQIKRLSENSIALLRAIHPRHLSQSQYRRLSEGPLGATVLELRRQGLLVPVVHKTSHGPEPCYYMPPGSSKIAQEVLMLMPTTSPSVEATINSELSRVGYEVRELRN